MPASVTVTQQMRDLVTSITSHVNDARDNIANAQYPAAQTELADAQSDLLTLNGQMNPPVVPER